MKGEPINACTERVTCEEEDFKAAQDVTNEYGGLGIFGMRFDVIAHESKHFDVRGSSGDIALLDAILNDPGRTKLEVHPVPLTLEQRVDRIEKMLNI